MPNKTKEYYFIDVDIESMSIVDWGETNKATLTGDTGDPNVHRVFLTKGQFNKLKKKLDH